MFDVVYVDPPWSYRNKKTGGSMKSGSEAKYPTLTLEEICLLPIRDIADKNSVLFLWVTTPLKNEVGMAVFDAWGYKYKTTIYWRKIMSLGMGYWFRGQVEEMWLGIRGKVKAFRLQEPNFLQTKVLKHSRKPPEFRALIERATANMKNPRRLELFATETVPGWTSLGHEIDGRDIRDALEDLTEGGSNETQGQNQGPN